MRVFIADDSAPVCEGLTAMLSEIEGVDVVGQAGDGLTATKSVLKLQPDVVILDIRMPAGSGIDVLRSIKGATPSPTVIMLTNYPYPQYRKKCADAGADFFFDKSGEFDKVAEVVERMARESAESGLGDT